MKMKNTLLLTFMCVTLFSPFCGFTEEVRPVAEFLKQREPHWRPKIVSYHSQGTPETVIFFEVDAESKQIPVKQIQFYPKGQPRTEMDLTVITESDPAFKDWKAGVAPHGVSVSYYESGKTEKVAGYDKGLLHGPMKVFYPNETMKAEGFFKLGVREGAIVSYFETGEKMEEGQFVNGKIEGEMCRYYQNGMKASIVPYKDGVPNGNALEWLDTGTMKACLRYTNGELHSDGTNPALVLYNPERAIIEVQDFKQGEPVGTHIKYHDNGKEIYKVAYKSGKKDGKEQFFSTAGKLLGEGKFQVGIPIGKHWRNYEDKTPAFIAIHDLNGVLKEPVKEPDNGKCSCLL